MPLTKQISTALHSECIKPAACVGMSEEARKRFVPSMFLKLTLYSEVMAHNWNIHLIISFSFVLQVCLVSFSLCETRTSGLSVLLSHRSTDSKYILSISAFLWIPQLPLLPAIHIWHLLVAIYGITDPQLSTNAVLCYGCGLLCDVACRTYPSHDLRWWILMQEVQSPFLVS